MDQRREALLNLDATLSRTLNEWREELTPEETATINELRALLSERFIEEDAPQDEED